ncbi:T9SS type A sorting domain-containing protein [bacterium]|nr:T9SS type A sorting domain-containing protein [bacterium]
MKYSRLSFLFILFVLIFYTSSLTARTEIQRIGWTMNLWARVVDIDIQGDYVYLIDYQTGIIVMDVSDPANPKCVDVFNNPEKSDGILINRERAYASSDHGAMILDISDPENVRQIGYIDENYQIYGGSIMNDVGYFGRYIVDLSDLDHPLTTSDDEIPYSVYDTDVDTNYYYVGGPQYFYIYNLSNLEDPRRIGYCELERGLSVQAAGEYIYVATSNGGLRVIDATRPQRPNVIESDTDTLTNVWVVKTAGDYAYAGGSFGLCSVDISDRSHPVCLNATGTRVRRLALQNNYAYGTDQDKLMIFDISDPDNLVQVCDHMEDRGARAVDVVGNLAYVSSIGSDSLGLYVLNVSDPAKPEIIGILNNSKRMYEIEIRGDYAYTAAWSNGFRIINVADPDNMFEIYENRFHYAQRVTLNGDYAFVSTNNGRNCYELHIFDISDPENCEEIHVMEGEFWTCASSDDLLYVSTPDSGMQIYNISNPAEPERIASYMTYNRVEDIELSDNLCFITTGETGLRILDVSVPSEPRSIRFYNTIGTAYDIEIEDNHVYICDGEYGFLVLDITDPEQPVEIGYSCQPLQAEKIEVENGLVFIPENYRLEIYDARLVLGVKKENIKIPDNYELLTAYPNPFNSTTTITYGLAKSAPTRLMLYDLTGREVLTLYEGFKQAGCHTATLTAGDLASGLYFVRLNAGGFRQSRKVVLVR